MSIWIYDPPAPWEVQFREATGLFAKGLGIEDVFGARLYMHEHGLRLSGSLPLSSFASKGQGTRRDWLCRLAVAVPVPVPPQVAQATRSPRRRVPNIANGCVAQPFEERLDYHYCGPSDLPDVDGDREDPQWNSFCTYVKQWNRDYPVRYRHVA